MTVLGRRYKTRCRTNRSKSDGGEARTNQGANDGETQEAPDWSMTTSAEEQMKWGEPQQEDLETTAEWHSEAYTEP